VCVKSHSACANLTMRVETNLVGVKITLVYVEITLCVYVIFTRTLVSVKITLVCVEITLLILIVDPSEKN
jgi:hypothetical protein